MKQYARNACGTVGMFHILCNLYSQNPALFNKDSKIGTFYESSKNLDSHARGENFEKNKDIKTIHKKHVEGGQSSVQEEVDSHFIAFVPYSIAYSFSWCNKWFSNFQRAVSTSWMALSAGLLCWARLPRQRSSMTVFRS